jgi:hypothetical protein
MEHLPGNDEKFDAERDYNSLKVQKRSSFFCSPQSFVALSILQEI